MKTRTKVLGLLLCAVLLVTGSVFGTMAYLTSQDSVVNTFTVGNVAITLEETDVDEDGKTDLNAYHLLPGHTYKKDPTVTVNIVDSTTPANSIYSEDCYVRMIVTVERMDELQLAMPKADFPEFYNGDVFLLQNLCLDDDNGNLTWKEDIWAYEPDGYSYDASATEPAATYEFRYVGSKATNGVVEKDETKEIELEPLFTHITVPGEVNNEQLAHLKNVEIHVAAHAIQEDGFADADAAWAAFGN